MAPAVNRLLPPFSASGARSSTTTLAPASRAARAAQKAALPPPSTTTSNLSDMTTPPSCASVCRHIHELSDAYSAFHLLSNSLELRDFAEPNQLPTDSRPRPSSPLTRQN